MKGSTNRPDLLRMYYKDLGRFQPYTKEEESELFRRAKAGDTEARNRLIEANLKYVFVIAKKYASARFPLLELISEGNAGLIRAYEKFDCDKDVKFYCYGIWWIRQYIVSYIMGEKENDDVGFRCEDEANVMSREPVYDFQENTLDYEDSVIDRMDTSRFTDEEILKNLMAVLGERESRIIREYYGIGCDERNLDEIGKELGLTQERVRQIKVKAIRRMRQELLKREDFSTIYL